MTRNTKRENSNGENPHMASGKTTKAIYFTSIVAIVLASSFLIQISSISPAEALTRYYNCIARVANHNATLSMANVDACYNLIFKGALDYYGIKQQPSDNKDTSSEDDSDKVLDSTKRQSDNSNSETQSEKVQGTSKLNDIFG